MKKILLLVSTSCFFVYCSAQQKFQWYTPKYTEGITKQDTTHIFHRLPAYMQPLVRKAVWGLSLNTAGEFLHFKTTARALIVKYVLANKNFAMPHMPATGVSGIDLYALDANGSWNWAPAKYSFGDTCVFVYKNLWVNTNRPTADFYLYLPLYNTVQSLSIGVSQEDKFSFEEERKEKPIVAYGTSILQGAVASRPGLAWTNILSRNLDREVINLGFSGNGRFEKPIFDLMAEKDAALYILDCMPNLTNPQNYPAEEIKNRLYYGIKKLREKHPEVPILLSEHADGYTPFYMDTTRLNEYHNASLVVAKIYETFKKEGFKNIYLLTDKEIGFDINSTTEGLHANDIGMMKYAIAYEKKIRKILDEPQGNITTEVPVEQSRDGYNWIKRHNQVTENIAQTSPRTILFGNSIINYWGGQPVAESGIARGEAAWQKYMKPLGIQNAGFGWDRIENVLWRVYHGELDNFKGNRIVLMIGTNNLQFNTDEEIVQGLAFLLQQIRSRKPKVQIIMVGILPRKGMEARVKIINEKIKTMAINGHYIYTNFSKGFLLGSKINSSLFINDGLHPNEKGYDVLGKYLSQALNN